MFQPDSRNRPEKDHLAQLRALHELFELRPTWRAGGEDERVRLVMMGSVRDEADARRVEGLEKEARELGISVRSSSTFSPERRRSGD